MSSSDAAALSFEELASELVGRLADASDSGNFDGIDARQFSQLFGSAIRFMAAKAQAGALPPPAGGNQSISPTDAVIACTAILESVNLAVFELAAWQSVSKLGSRQNETPSASME
ncbi:hypothetical protein AB7M35_002864 [Amorphus suaedae]